MKSRPLSLLLRAFIVPSKPIARPTVAMSTTTSATEPYVPPKVWKFESSDGSTFTMNRPTAGSRSEKEVPIGKHPIQLYSLGTPNGMKVTIMLEELLESGKDAEYDAWMTNIMEGDQFGSGFVAINPNSKIPAMNIYDSAKSDKPSRIFESGSMLLHLAEKFDAFLPSGNLRTETLNWLFWQMGSAPYLGGGFFHFYSYATVKQQYPIDRFTMEVKRELDVLNIHLANHKYMVGDEYTIADMAIYPWYGRVVLGTNDAATFLNVEEDYPHVIRWAKEIESRPAVKRGVLVNTQAGLRERHDASDFDAVAEKKD